MPEDLVGISEIASRAFVAYETVRTWRRRYPDFPEPVVELAIGPVWSWPEVKEWIDKRL